MAQEMSPSLYAAHAGIPYSTVEAWLTGRGAKLFDPRDIRVIHGKLTLIAVQAPNASGQGARPRFVDNPAYKYTRKSVHESGRAGAVEIVPVEGAGVPGMPEPTPEDVQGNAALGVVRREGVTQTFEVADGKASARHG